MGPTASRPPVYGCSRKPWGVPVDYFFGEAGARGASESGPQSRTNAMETYNLIRAFSSMDVQPRKRLLSLARSLSTADAAQHPASGA